VIFPARKYQGWYSARPSRGGGQKSAKNGSKKPPENKTVRESPGKPGRGATAEQHLKGFPVNRLGKKRFHRGEIVFGRGQQNGSRKAVKGRPLPKNSSNGRNKLERPTTS